MDKNSNFYMDAMVANRAMLLDEETSEDEQEASFFDYVHSHFADFLRNLRQLTREDQELLLEYYVLGKTQSQLAVVHEDTQTHASYRIRLAIKKLMSKIALGEPTEETIHEILAGAGIKDDIEGKVTLSRVILERKRGRSFDHIQLTYRLSGRRRSLRIVLLHIARQLLETGKGREAALGAFISDLTSLPQKRHRKARHVVTALSAITGEFRIDVTDPDFHQIFTSRANC